MFGLKFRKNLPCQKGKASSMRVKNLQSHCEIDIGMERQVSVSASSSQEVEMEILCKWTGNSTPTGWNEKIRVTSEGRPFVPKNFHLTRAFHLNFNRLNRRFG